MTYDLAKHFQELHKEELNPFPRPKSHTVAQS